MGKIRRGNYVFLSWAGDHGPRHVHVYEDKKLIVKWDLEHGVAMKGKATGKILKLIAELQQEGRL
ncbi:MAG: DUF4160 domain-containing protein [Thermoguttaceae bacterium]|jgi:hypothetical protein